MHAHVLVLLPVLAVGQLDVLKTFREEFVTIETKGTNLRPYAIAKYEVPQNLWSAVMGTTPSRWKGPRNSVEMLSLHEAQDFCDKATRQMRSAGLISKDERVRLPTEAEWEHAARAGTKTKFSFGEDAAELTRYAWYTGNAAGNDPPVGAKKPNPWGLYDIHGYLWEWTYDPAAANSQGVIRGGSWKDAADLLTSASRRTVATSLRDDAIGLRCVLATEEVSGRRKPPGDATNESGRRKSPGDAATQFVSQLTTEFQPTAQDTIAPAGAKIEKLWADGDFTEGPALAPDGSIFFSDIGESIYRYDPQTNETKLFRRPSGRTNGLMFNQDGALIACEGANTGGNRRISITTGIEGGKEGTVRTLADRYEGKRFNSPNDLAIDSQGRVYFSDPRYVGSEPRELDFEAVFLVSPSGDVKIATREVTKPNGILVSPDGKTVYVADHHPEGTRQLTSFAVESDGKLASKRVLYDFGKGRGIDGMALDTRGNLYATAGAGDKAGVYVFGPAGQALALIPTPGDPTNCEFGGGPDGSSLYITCANEKRPGTKYGLYRIKLNATGQHVVKMNTIQP